MRRADVSLLVEAINSGDRPGAFIQRQGQAAELIGILGSDRIRLLVDFYHCQTAQGDLTRTFQRHAPLIGHVQVADVPTRPEPRVRRGYRVRPRSGGADASASATGSRRAEGSTR